MCAHHAHPSPLQVSHTPQGVNLSLRLGLLTSFHSSGNDSVPLCAVVESHNLVTRWIHRRMAITHAY